MTHVTFVAGTYQPNQCGVADYTAHLRSHLAQQGVRSSVLTTHAAARAVNDPSVRGAVDSWSFGSLIALARTILSVETDILHIQHAAGTYRFQRSIFLLPLLLRSLGYRPPIVTTAHEYGWWEWEPAWIPAQLLESLKAWGQKRYWWDREDGFLLTESQTIITTNDNIANIIRDRLPALCDRLMSIPIAANIDVVPVNWSDARLELQQRCHWPDYAQVIVFFGFLHPVKGIETLLKAFQQVMACHPQARLLLVGGVETLSLQGAEAAQYWNKLQQVITDLNLESTVYRTGYVDVAEASRYLSGADIGVLPFNPGVTLKSGSLLALLAHKLPTIITQSDETDAVLRSGDIVALVPSRDVDGLASQLIQLLSDSEKRDRLSQAGYQFVQQFTWPAIAEKHLKVYTHLLQYK